MDVFSAVGRLMTPEGVADPYPSYRALHEHAPVLPLGDTLALVVGFAEAEQVLRDPTSSVVNDPRLDASWPDWRDNRAAAMLHEVILFRDEPDHARVRRCLAGWFTARRIAGMAGRVRHHAEELADGLLAAGGPTDLVAGLALPLPVALMGEILGVPAADHGWFAERTGDVLAVVEQQQDPEELERAHRSTAQIEAYLVDLIAEKRRNPVDDVTSALVAVHDADPATLSEQELLLNLVGLLAAALDSTTYLLANALAHLATNPPFAERLRADDAFARPYVEELLRWDGPAQFTLRRTTVPTQIGEVPLPPEAEVMIVIGAAGRDPRRFADPDRFDPDRPDRQSLAFGVGAHYCIGAALARLEAETALPAVVRRLPGLALAGEPVRSSRFAIRSYRAMPATVGTPAAV